MKWVKARNRADQEAIEEVIQGLPSEEDTCFESSDDGWEDHQPGFGSDDDVAWFGNSSDSIY